MPKFILTYHAPTGYAPGDAENVTAWRSWFDSMGDRLDDIGNPVFQRSAVGNLGDGTELFGYSLVNADDLEDAVTIAKGCPFVQDGGGVAVGKLEDLPS